LCHLPGAPQFNRKARIITANSAEKTMSTSIHQSVGKVVTLFALATLVFTGCATKVCVESTASQSIPFTAQNGGSGSGCPGSWTGYAKMTNSLGTFAITPPPGTTNGIFTDASGFAPPYVSVAYVKRNDLVTWCGTNSVSFPASNSKNYQLTIYVKSALPPPTNGQPMNLHFSWQ
jgi:hypothetical protein